MNYQTIKGLVAILALSSSACTQIPRDLYMNNEQLTAYEKFPIIKSKDKELSENYNIIGALVSPIGLIGDIEKNIMLPVSRASEGEDSSDTKFTISQLPLNVNYRHRDITFFKKEKNDVENGIKFALPITGLKGKFNSLKIIAVANKSKIPICKFPINPIDGAIGQADTNIFEHPFSEFNPNWNQNDCYRLLSYAIEGKEDDKDITYGPFQLLGGLYFGAGAALISPIESYLKDNERIPINYKLLKKTINQGNIEIRTQKINDGSLVRKMVRNGFTLFSDESDIQITAIDIPTETPFCIWGVNKDNTLDYKGDFGNGNKYLCDKVLKAASQNEKLVLKK